MRAIAFVSLLLLVAPRITAAQEFAAPGAPLAGTPATLLERALPPSLSGASFQSIGVRWFGLAELATTSAAASVSWRGGRAALGLSRTGTEALGWSAIALAGGWADERCGVAARVAGRETPAGGARLGVESGAGAWVEAAPGARLWASAPQLWSRGAAPPLARRLELGAVFRSREFDVWASRASSPGTPQGLRGEHAAGVVARAGATDLWTEIRDRPARAAFGLSVAWKPCAIACQVDGHPVLGDTWKLALTFGASR